MVFLDLLLELGGSSQLSSTSIDYKVNGLIQLQNNVENA